MVSEKKKQTVKEVEKEIDSHTVVGIVNFFKLPARQLDQIKLKLKDKAKIKMVKKNLIKLVLEKSKKPGIKELENFISGQPAFIFTNSNPFDLAKVISASKSKVAAKEGDVASSDILVTAGPTGLMAGPAIGELQRAKIPAAVEEGKIVVKQDTVVVKEGEAVTNIAADVLGKLGVEPMDIGLDLVAVLDDKTIYKKDILFIPAEKYMEDLEQAHLKAFNLSVNINYFTPENIVIFLSKASQEADSLVMSAGVITKDTIKPLLAKAHSEAEALKNKANA